MSRKIDTVRYVTFVFAWVFFTIIGWVTTHWFFFWVFPIGIAAFLCLALNVLILYVFTGTDISFDRV